MAIWLQEYRGLILNPFNFIFKIAWLAGWYFSSLLKSNLHLANSFSISLLGNKTCMLDFQPLASEGEEEEEIPSPHHAGGSSSSFMETYPHFLA